MTKRQFQKLDDAAEANALEAALRDPAGWPKPSDGFADRCLEAVLKAQTAPRQSLFRRYSRPLKVAASIAAMLAFTALASWFAAERLAPDETASPSVPAAAVAVDAETEMISKESEVKMIARKMAGIVGAAMTTLAVGATEMTSEPTFVFLKPETSSFWHTATNNTMTVPIDFPSGATSAKLYVSGVKYNQTYENITTSEYTFELQPADSPEKENVYDIALVFNDDAETRRTAKLGLIQGLCPDSEGITRCIAPSNGRLWGKARGRAVLPIPYGTTELRVDGETVDTGLNGAQGWYALPIKGGRTVSLSLIAGELNYEASLLGGGTGFMLIFK